MVRKNIVVGAFVITGLALFTVGMVAVGDRRQVFGDHVAYCTEFFNLQGLAKGSRVQVGGMDAGDVEDIAIPNSPPARFRVTFRVDGRLRGIVRTDSLAMIGTAGVVGDTFLSIRPGSSQALEARPFSTLGSKESVTLSDMLDQSQGLLQQVGGTLKDVQGRLDGALDGATGTLANVNSVVVGLKQGRGTAGMLLDDDVLAGTVRRTVDNAQGASEELLQTAKQVNGVVSDLASRKLPEQIDRTMGTAGDAVNNIDASTRALNGLIQQITKPDIQGMDAGANIRESLSNVNAATSNMAEETDALKRNFLFRGFFRRRGYYDLKRIPANQYRKDKLFIDSRNGRAWLSAADLFQRDAQDREVISPNGGQYLRQALAQFGDSIIDDPIMIEGYSDASTVSDQLSLSRSRAILVRQYLYSRFQVDADRMGVVSLRKTPPLGIGKTNWDGVCLVMVRGRSAQ
jgi:phospholipid/cholesterol/gamma-HCH transport system substrate-binding protein